MRYAEIYSIVDGASGREGNLTDYLRAGEFVRSIAQDAASDGVETEVYVIMHNHAPGECECAQFLTDHHPTWIFPEDGVDSVEEYAAHFA